MSTLDLDRITAFKARLRKAFLSDPAWKRISLTRKRRRHWKRQHCRPWKNLQVDQ